MPERIKVTSALVAMLAVVAVGGCGVSTSGAPEDIGGAASIGNALSNDGPPRQPDGPDLTGEPEKLVRLYLLAAAGGDNQAPTRQREFLTGNARAAWHAPAEGLPLQMTIIRMIGAPNKLAQQGDRTPVEVTYQVVGSLNDQGQVTPLSDSSVNHKMTFWVVSKDDTNLRIDEIKPNGDDLPQGMMLSDEALTLYYRPQPIYFWDSANTRLIPDIRYLPLTLIRDQRAQKVVQWLLGAPSSWLGGAAQPLPSGTTTKEGVTNQNGTWYINLSAPGATGGPEAIQRLYHQLQWSLDGLSNNTPSIKLSIEGKLQSVTGSPDDYLHFNLSNELDQVKQANYDIVDTKVVGVPGSVSQPGILSAKENIDVVYAAVNRVADTMALVRTVGGKTSLQIVHGLAGPRVGVKLSPKANGVGRPVWIPGTQLLLVPCAGRLWLVQPTGDVIDIMPRASGITSVSVAPDGRRVAWVENGDAYVAPLLLDPARTTVSILNPRLVVPHQLEALAVAWSNEAWLYVVGTANNLPAMWRSTVDSAVAEDKSTLLQGATPHDVVAFAAGEAQSPGQVLLYTDKGKYTFLSLLGADNTVKNPFFVS